MSGHLSRKSQRTFARQRGMTLPELMVVVVSLGVLTTAALGSYREHVAAAHSAEAVATLGAVQKATERSASVMSQYGDKAFNFRVNTFGSTKGFGNGNGNSDKVNKDADLDNDGNNGHGNNEGKCDPSNPGKSKHCDAGNSDTSTDSDGGSSDGAGESGNDSGSDSGDSGADTSSGPSDSGGDDSSNDSSESGGNAEGSDDSGSDASDQDSGGDESSDESSNDDAADDSDGQGAGDIEHLCGSADPVPSSISQVKGGVYLASPSEWSTGSRESGWKCLGMSRSGNQRYQYGYDLGSGGEDASESYTAWARGDLDADGRTSLFRMRGELIDGTLVHAPSIEIVDPTE